MEKKSVLLLDDTDVVSNVFFRGPYNTVLDLNVSPSESNTPCDTWKIDEQLIGQGTVTFSQNILFGYMSGRQITEKCLTGLELKKEVISAGKFPSNATFFFWLLHYGYLVPERYEDFNLIFLGSTYLGSDGEKHYLYLRYCKEEREWRFLPINVEQKLDQTFLAVYLDPTNPIRIEERAEEFEIKKSAMVW